MNPLNYGDLSKLTDWLSRQKGDIVKVTDDERAQITGSIDKRSSDDSFFPIEDNAKYSIVARARAAGFDVSYDPMDLSKRTKIFRRL